MSKQTRDRARREAEQFSLEKLLDDLAGAGDGASEKISVGTLLDVVGRRAFGPVILVPGLIALSPLSGIPGLPSVVGLTVMLLVGQLLLGRRQFWLPRWMLARKLPRARLGSALKAAKPAARAVDRITRPRLVFLTQGAGFHIVALICFVVAMTMPPMELVPFANSAAGATLTIFALSLVTHDGYVAILAVLCAALVAYLAYRAFAG